MYIYITVDMLYIYAYIHVYILGKAKNDYKSTKQMPINLKKLFVHWKSSLLCFKDTLKAFDDFKNKQKSVRSHVFWCVNVYSESVMNTLYTEVKDKC